MKKLSISVLLVVFLGVAAAANAGTAKLQVIHNAADPAAALVDIYVNGNLFLNDFSFRAATPFVDVPSDVNLTIGVAPASSSSSADVIASFPAKFAKGKTYVAIANGVLDPSAFAANPDGRSIAFSIFPRENVRTRSQFPWLVSAIAFHGASDAPTVDILAESTLGDLRLIDDLGYAGFSSYKFLLPKKYILKVTPGGDNKTVVASFEANLSGIGGGAAVVFASGFLTPSANQAGAAFGLFAALPNGAGV